MIGVSHSSAMESGPHRLPEQNRNFRAGFKHGQLFNAERSPAKHGEAARKSMNRGPGKWIPGLAAPRRSGMTAPEAGPRAKAEGSSERASREVAAVRLQSGASVVMNGDG